jgi:hypothetical protein
MALGPFNLIMWTHITMSIAVICYFQIICTWYKFIGKLSISDRIVYPSSYMPHSKEIIQPKQIPVP